MIKISCNTYLKVENVDFLCFFKNISACIGAGMGSFWGYQRWMRKKWGWNGGFFAVFVCGLGYML